MLALAGAGLVVALAFPLAAVWAIGAWGVRAAAAAVLGLGLASLALSLQRRAPGSPAWLRALPLALPALAAATGDVRFLALVPAAVEGLLAAVFLGSLRGGGSLLQQAALTLEPYAPDFIAPYCRKATLAFGVLFIVQAVALVALALRAPAGDWARDASLVVWVPTLASTALEFAVRKAWFRHYGDNPVDRVLRALMPPENTARGRRSLDYIRKKRLELGLPPP